MSSDRRGDERVKKYIVVRIPEFGLRTQYTSNISAGGLLIESSRFYDLNREIKIELMIPNVKPIHARTKVAWIYPRTKDAISYKIGLEFSNISPEDKEKLLQLATFFQNLRT